MTALFYLVKEMWKENCKIAYKFKNANKWLIVPKDGYTVDGQSVAITGGKFKLVCDHNPYHDKLGRFTTASGAGGYVQASNIEEANKNGNSILGALYENNRIAGNLNLVARSELGNAGENWGLADYGKLPVEVANVMNRKISELGTKFNSKLTSIRPMNFMEYQTNKQAFASVSTAYSFASSKMVLNPAKLSDYNAMVGRVKSLSLKGYCVKIAQGKEAEYVATHEFAHTLVDMRSPLVGKQNFTKMDYGKVKQVRKEINNVYKRYAEEITSLKQRAMAEDKKAMELGNSSQNQEAKEMSANAFRNYFKLMDELKTKKVSDYALSNADEFMAECFTDVEIGANPSPYSVEVHDILTKHFGR